MITHQEINEAKVICKAEQPTDYQKKRLIKLRVQAEGGTRKYIPFDAVEKFVEKHGLDKAFITAKNHFGYEQNTPK